MALQITSPAFSDGGEIPKKYTCEGEDLSPPLAFAGVPAGTKSLVLIVDDPDAPDPKAPKMTYVHWVLFDLPPDTSEIVEGMAALPSGTKSGLNDWKRAGLWRPVSADRTAPLFLQAVRARCPARRPVGGDQGGRSGGDARARACRGADGRHLSEGRLV